MIVRDREGVRKRILRTEGETVFWEYLNGDRGANGAGEYSTEYSEFADTHYVVPKAKRSEPAEQGAPEGITKGTIYVNAEGRRVRVMEVGEKIVRWTEVEDDSVGVTPIQEFLKTFRPEGRRPESPSAA